MNYFRYKLLSSSGKISSGTAKLPFQDVMSAISHFEKDGSMTIYVKKAGPLYAFYKQHGSLRFQKKMSRSDQAELLNNLSLMIRSGLPISTALKESAYSTDLTDISNDIDDMISTIEGGGSFSETAAKYGHIFPKTILHLIRIGEETGKLDEMLKAGAEHLKRMESIISDTKQALLYPSFVFVAMGIGLIFWFYFVVPKILSLFKEMDVTLPPLTVFLVNLSEFIQSYLFHMIVMFVLSTVFLSTLYGKSKPFKRVIDLLLLKPPVVGTIITASTLAFITEYLSLLLNAGIDILKSMSILKDSIKNEIYREKIEEIRQSIIKGDGIGSAFTNAAMFPSFVTRMISVGELSGTLTEQLNYIAEEYKNRLSVIVATIGKSIEPIVLVVAGAMFAIIIGGLFLPIYDLITQIAK